MCGRSLQICALVAHWWAEQQHAPVWEELLDEVRNEKNSLSRVTLQKKKTWVAVTTQNPNSSPLCAKAHHVHICKKPEKSGQISKAYWHLFLNVKKLFIRNLPLLAKWLLGGFAKLKKSSQPKTAQALQQFLSAKNITVIPHPHLPNLPYFAQYDLFLFLGTELWLSVATRSLFPVSP